MPNYRRAIVAGGTYFFTIVTYNRTKIFSDPAAVSILGDTIVEAKQVSVCGLKAATKLQVKSGQFWVSGIG